MHFVSSLNANGFMIADSILIRWERSWHCEHTKLFLITPTHPDSDYTVQFPVNMIDKYSVCLIKVQLD